MGFSNPLKVKPDPFGREASNPILISVQSAFDAVMREIGSGTPVIVIAGPTGFGKTFLIGLIEQAQARGERSVRRIERGDLANIALLADCDVLLVDEADSTDPATLQNLLSDEGDKRPASIVFACRPAATPRFVGKCQPVFVTLRALSPEEARRFLLGRAENAGRPDLFSSDALDRLIAASSGSARLLKSIGGHALFFAESEGASQITPKHVEDAVLAQFGVPSSIPGEPKSEGQEGNPLFHTDAVTAKDPDTTRCDAEGDPAMALADLPLDESRLWDPVPDSRMLFAAATVAVFGLILALLYHQTHGGPTYATSVGAKPIIARGPVTDPLEAMQKVADSITPHPIVLTLISTAPLQPVVFAKNVLPLEKHKVASARRSTQAQLRGRDSPSISGDRRKLRGSHGLEAKLVTAKGGAQTRWADAFADEPTAFDRLRNFISRQFWVDKNR